MQAYDTDGNYEQAAVNSESLAETFLYEGNLCEALIAVDLGRGGLPYAELSSNAFRRMQTVALKGQIVHFMGRVEEAEEAFATAEQIRVEQCGTRRPIGSLYLLDLLGEAGRYEELLQLANRFHPLLDSRKAKSFTGGFYLFLGQGLGLRSVREGDLSSAGEALRLLDNARRLIDESMLPHLQARAPCIRARLLTDLGKFEQAKSDLDWALSFSEHARLRIYEIDSLVGFTYLYLRSDDPSTAGTYLERARRVMTHGSYARPKRLMEELTTRIQAREQSST
jgi:tetratricopeptide (TPR) repeat protein